MNNTDQLLEAIRAQGSVVQTLLDKIDTPVMILDQTGRIAYLNASSRFCDLGQLEVNSCLWDLFIFSGELQDIKEYLVRREYEKIPENFYLLCGKQPQKLNRTLWTRKLLYDDDRQLQYIFCTAHRRLSSNIQDPSENESLVLTQLREHAQYIENMIEKAPIGIWSIAFLPLEDNTGEEDPCRYWHHEIGDKIIIKRINSKLSEMLGFSREEMVGHSIFHPRFVDKPNARIFATEIYNRRQGKGGSYEILLRHKSGLYQVPVLIKAIPAVLDEKTGKVKESIGMLLDLSELKKTEEKLQSANQALQTAYSELSKVNQKLEKLSITDALTGIANRRYLEQFLESQWESAFKNQTELSLLMVDVDAFKAYNDNYGHRAGDVCMKKIAAALASQTPAHGLLARYGGEEFAIVLPATGQQAATQIAENMRREIFNMGIDHSKSPTADKLVTISAGISTVVPTAKINSEMLIHAADEALYKAKNSGRNRIVYANLPARES